MGYIRNVKRAIELIEDEAIEHYRWLLCRSDPSSKAANEASKFLEYLLEEQGRLERLLFSLDNKARNIEKAIALVDKLTGHYKIALKNLHDERNRLLKELLRLI
jgi:hypothetical protein